MSYAAAAGQLGTLTLLLETAKAVPGKGNNSGWTPLMQVLLVPDLSGKPLFPEHPSKLGPRGVRMYWLFQFCVQL